MNPFKKRKDDQMSIDEVYRILKESFKNRFEVNISIKGNNSIQIEFDDSLIIEKDKSIIDIKDLVEQALKVCCNEYGIVSNGDKHIIVARRKKVVRVVPDVRSNKTR